MLESYNVLAGPSLAAPPLFSQLESLLAHVFNLSDFLSLLHFTIQSRIYTDCLFTPC